MSDQDSTASDVQSQADFRLARGVKGQADEGSTDVRTPATRAFVVSSKRKVVTVRFIPRRSDSRPSDDSMASET